MPDTPRQQEASKAAILFIGTDRYLEFFPNFYATLRRKFLPRTPKTFFVFTDLTQSPLLGAADDVVVVPVLHYPFPRVNLLKFRFILQAADLLREYPLIVYVDADTYADSTVSEEEFFCHDRPLFAVRHFRFQKKPPVPEAFELRSDSEAAVAEGDDLSTYWQASFWGGRREEFLAAVETLSRRTDRDLEKGIVAKWWDESFLNKYLIDHKPLVHTYPSGYSWPDSLPLPEHLSLKLLHLSKNPPEIADSSSIKETVRKAGRGG